MLTILEGPQTFQVRSPRTSKILYGTLAEHWEALLEMNRAGHEILFAVNQTNGSSSKPGDKYLSKRDCEF